MQYSRIQLYVEDKVARLVLNARAGGNRIDDRLLGELDDACERIAEDEDIVVALIEAEGDDFCLGWEEGTRAGLVSALTDARTRDIFGCVADLSIPVVVALQGRVESAGFELALSCDVRLAATNARFVMPDIADGVLPLAGGVQRLARIAGRATALAMLLAGEALDAEAALRRGIVSRLFTPAELGEGSRELARKTAERGPVALRYAKEAVNAGTEMPLAQALRLETDLSVLLQATQDRDAGVRAFVEREAPRFEGH